MKHIYLKTLSALPEMFLNYYLHNEVDSLLDFGCGYGFWFYLLNHHNILPKTAVGVDSDLGMCQYMVKHIQKVHSVYGSVTQVKFGDKPFDMAVCNQVIEHTEDDEKVVENLSHSLKDKGILYISSIAREPGAWYIHAYNGEPRLSPMHIKEYADLDEFVALLKRHKFKILQARSKQFYLKWWNTPFHIGTGKLGVPIPKFKRIEALVQK